MTRYLYLISAFIISAGVASLSYWAAADVAKDTWSNIETIIVTVVAPIIIFSMFFFTFLAYQYRNK